MEKCSPNPINLIFMKFILIRLCEYLSKSNVQIGAKVINGTILMAFLHYIARLPTTKILFVGQTKLKLAY